VDFLSLLADAGAQEKTFDLRMAHRVTGLLREGNTVVGVRYTPRTAWGSCAPAW